MPTEEHTRAPIMWCNNYNVDPSVKLCAQRSAHKKIFSVCAEDTWVADSGTGSCKATWARIGGNWMITKVCISTCKKTRWMRRLK